MVIRVWTYRVSSAESARFEQFEQQFGLPMVRAQPGCLSVEFFRRLPESSEGRQTDLIEYTMISKWVEQAYLDTALASKDWREEISLFRSQKFSDSPGDTRHYQQIA